MRRGFLNQPNAKPKHRQYDGVAPPQPPSSITQYPNSDNLIRSDEEVKQWAHKLGMSRTELSKHLENHSARTDNGGIVQTVYRNLVFRDFEGVTLTDSKILELLPRYFGTRPPALDAYRISVAAGKGRGMFATRDIPAGGVILVENPVIVIPLIMDLGAELSKEQMFQMLFDRLDTDVRERALALWNCKPADLCGKEEGIVRTNGLQVELPTPNVSNAPNSMHSGTFLDISRCNHSCGPNAGRKWNVDSYSMSLFALRPIHAGEEITITYTQVDDTRAVRRAKLLEMYYFVCECGYCNLPDDAVAASDAARMEIKEMWKDGNPDAKWVRNRLPGHRIVRLHEKAIELLEREGIYDIQYVAHMESLSFAYIRMGDEKNFKIWAKKAKERWEVMQDPDRAVDWEKIQASRRESAPQGPRR